MLRQYVSSYFTWNPGHYLMARRHSWAMISNIKSINFDDYKFDDFDNFMIGISLEKEEGNNQFMDSYYWYMNHGFYLST
jgi:hypothetical protein